MRLVFACVALAWSCGSDEVVPPTQGDAPADAPVVDSNDNDAVIDGSDDANLPVDAALGSITITVRGLHSIGPTEGVPQPGVPVIVTDPNNIVVAFETTNLDGQASALIEVGSSVTVVRHDFGHPHLYTVVGVHPGDAIVFGAPNTMSSNSGQMSLVTDPLPAGATSTGVVNGCGLGASGSVFPVEYRCTTTPFPIAMVALAAATDPRWIATATDVSYVPDGTVSLSPWQVVQPTTFELDNIPDDAMSVSIVAIQETFGRTFNTVGEVFEPVGSQVAATVENIYPTGRSVVVDVTIEWSTSTTHLASSRYSPTALSGSTIDIDLSTILLPRPTIVSFDHASHTLGWDESGTGSDRVNVQAAALQYRHGSDNVYWWIYAPRTSQHQISFPRLHDSLEHLAPTTGDAITKSVRICEYPGGFDAQRTTPNSLGMMIFEPALPFLYCSGTSAGP